LASEERVKRRKLIEAKLSESAVSVLPILLIVTALALTISPVGTDLMLSFLLGACMVILGMGLFTIGTETSMTPIGRRIGTALTKSKKLWLILLMSILLGCAITYSEPDLQVLATTVPHISTKLLMITVSIGVGCFLALSMLRTLVGWRLRWLLLGFYGLIFLLAAFADPDFWGVAFDSGGVTTGPMTVPFILALGVGAANIRSDRKAETDSFGLVALCSIGPVLAVLILGFFNRGESETGTAVIRAYTDTAELGKTYWQSIPIYLWETLKAMFPIAVIFLGFQAVMLKLPLRVLGKIGMGLMLAYLGLTLFLTGVNVGFSSMGYVLGVEMADGRTGILLIPLAMILGWFIISAEPAVYVLQQQIGEVSAGAIPGKAIRISLSIAISLAMGLSMLRVVTGISVLWFLIPGYAIALILSFFVPDIFTAIAFDSGGVASGPMTATFMLQFFMGASVSLGGNLLRDAFGLVAMVAMMPLITVQVLGVLYSRREHSELPETPLYGDCEIIELWEDRA